MKVLVIGGGGREHALAWKLAQSPKVQAVYVAPGNGGTTSDRRIENVVLEADFLPEMPFVQRICAWAAINSIAITVVGPEAPLAAGVVDEFKKHGLRVFGPTQAAAQLESSKAFSKAFMVRHGIPTAACEVFTDVAAAKAYIQNAGVPIVVKADGLAAGKGVVVATTMDQAFEAVQWMLDPMDNKLGVSHNASADGQSLPRVVVEEFMAGEEASFIVMCDGTHVCALATSQDHKRLLDGDLGPNTGGMGAYSPAPVVTAEVYARAMREIILPTVRGMAAEGMPFTGFLYAGLMIDAAGKPKTVEFNARLGDPEAQVVLPRLKSDLMDAIWAATDGKLDQIELQWDRRTALGVVLAAHGYPEKPRSGDRITGLPSSKGAVAEAGEELVFHGGTVLRGDECLSTGGRVLCAVALADSPRAAQLRAYALVAKIQLDGMQYRTDIGGRAIKPYRPVDENTQTNAAP